MLQGLRGDVDVAQARSAEALEIQERNGDREGAGMSLGGLAKLAADRRDPVALDLYLQSLAAFEAIGDRGEEARVLSEMAWTYLDKGDTDAAHRNFFESVQAHSDIASVRGVGLSSSGWRPRRRSSIVPSGLCPADETPGREFVEQARAALSADELIRATEAGRRLTIEEALELARAPRVAA
jgi:hypothetical protein